MQLLASVPCAFYNTCLSSAVSINREVLKDTVQKLADDVAKEECALAAQAKVSICSCHGASIAFALVTSGLCDCT